MVVAPVVSFLKMILFLVTLSVQLIVIGLAFTLSLILILAWAIKFHSPAGSSTDNHSSSSSRDEVQLRADDLNIYKEIADYKAALDSASPQPNYFKTNLLISKNVDVLIEEIIDLIFRDYLYDWYNDLTSPSTEEFDLKLKNEIWTLLSRLLALCRQFDDISFLTKDLVTIIHSHVSKISSIISKQDNYDLYDHFSTKEKELHYLNKVSHLILALLLPTRYAKSQPVINLLKEILGIHVLHNLFELLSDPDHINQMIVDYVKSHLDEAERHRKTYAYAKSYEDFVEIIKSCNSVDDLKKIRYRIVSEIMQATALENLKRQKLLDKESRPSQPSSSLAKGDLLLNRDLKRYINNLQYAKNLCSKRINYLITCAYPSVALTTDNPESVLIVDSLTNFRPMSKTILAFDIIIRSDLCRSFMRRFLQNSLGNSADALERTSKYLVLFWESVEEMRNQKGVKQYQIANELLKHSYFLNALSIHLKLGKNDRKGMEAFVRGDKGPESFYEAQTAVYSVLVNRYYPLFIVSKEYDEMIDSHNSSDLLCTNSDLKIDTETSESISSLSLEMSMTIDSGSSVNRCVIQDHISSARVKLKELNKKMTGKQQALDAITDSEHESNSRLAELLSKEIQELREEMFELENHIIWSENWIKNLDHWQAELHNVQLEASQSTSPLVIIIISSKEIKHEKSSADGWIIARTISDFIELKRKLVRINSNLKRIEILRLKNVAPTNVNLINRARVNLQLFLDQIIRDENCVKSEEVYLFFCPSSGALRVPLSFSKQVNFWNLPFASFFGITNPDSSEANSVTGKGGESDSDDEEDQQLLFDDDLESKDDNIAEPLYNLLTEIFELKGAMGFLRRTLIVFVHTTYGQTINKQLRETVSWTFSESMIHYYLTNLKLALWPNGKPAPPRKPSSESEKRKNQFLAKRLLIDNIPDILLNLFGQQNCRKGFLKLFDFIQNQNLNKQLLYEILETFILQFVPQLKETN